MKKTKIDDVEYVVIYEGKTKYTKSGYSNYQPEFIDFEKIYYFCKKEDAEAVVKTILNHDVDERCESSSFQIKPIFLTEEEIQGKIIYKSKLDFYRQNIKFAELDPEAKKDKQIINKKYEEIRESIYSCFKYMPSDWRSWHFNHKEFIEAFKQIGVDFLVAYKSEAVLKSGESYSYYFPSVSEAEKVDSILTKSKKFSEVYHYSKDPFVCFKQEFELGQKKLYQNTDEFLEANPEFKQYAGKESDSDEAK